MLNQTLNGDNTAVCVAKIIYMKSCVYLFHTYFLSVHHMPEIILDTGIPQDRTSVYTQVPPRLPSPACKLTILTPANIM